MGATGELLDSLYQQLIKLSINQNRTVERQLRRPLQNYHKIYNQITMPFGDDRQITIRYVKIPTFTRENRPQYYTAFITDLPYYRLGEIKDIHKQCIECIEKTDVDSYTIFLIGKLHGFINPVINKPFRWYKTFVINTESYEKAHEHKILHTIKNFLETRCNHMESNGITFGSIKQDIERIRLYTEMLHVLYSDMSPMEIIR